jgi:hypothetical protein
LLRQTVTNLRRSKPTAHAFLRQYETQMISPSKIEANKAGSGTALPLPEPGSPKLVRHMV